MDRQTQIAGDIGVMKRDGHLERQRLIETDRLKRQTERQKQRHRLE